MTGSTSSHSGDVRITVLGADKSRRSQRKPRTKPGRSTCTNWLLNTRDCAICGVPGCNIVTHRIATLQVLKRSAKSTKKRSGERPTHSSIHIRSSAHAQREHSHLVKSPSVVENLIDPFTAFPVPGATKDMMRQFHDFFTQQGGFVTNHNRRLVFDQRNFATLYPKAMRNPALCMSVISLASTYNIVHFRDESTPDAETLSVYGQTFEMIRTQIDEEPTPEIIECTIHAVHRLAMACGVAFGDAEASITHWNGVLALLDKFPHLHLSGGVMGYVTQMEYWVAINPGVKPRSNEWPILLEHDKPPPKRYGQDLSKLFELPDLRSELTPKLLSVSLTTCRATELLEADVAVSALPSRGSNHVTSPSPYFMHLFDVLLRQQARLYTALMYRNDMVECVCITFNIYFMIVVRCTPWRAPLEHLCTRLRHSLVSCETVFKLEASTSKSDTTTSIAEKAGKEMMKDLYMWMLIVCACALQLCRNRPCQDWALESLRTVCRDDLSLAHESGQAEVLRRVRRFCWSDTFLSIRFEELCNVFNHSV